MTQTQTKENTGASLLSVRKGPDSLECVEASAVEILVGPEALLELEDTYFKSQWDQLSDKCAWGTVFQGRAFVSTWYSLYQNHYIPIIVRCFHDGELIGLLTLAKEQNSKLIHVAGVKAAHYQTWLASQEQGENFIQDALRLLRREFPLHEINFYNTPPQTPITWAKHDPFWQYHCTVRAFERPLMDFRKPNILELLNSKRSRRRIKQLEKAGRFHFEHVTSIERFKIALDILADQHDFRKAAKYNWLEFRVDPIKKKFLHQLFEQGLLHVTVLTLNGDIIASIVDLIGNDKWIYGSEIATYNCRYAKYSPGTVNFLLLGQQLLHDGYHVYDLTPGHDPYKKKLSNAHDYVHEIKIKSVLQTFLSNKVVLPIRAITKNVLIKSNLSTKELKDKAYLLFYQLKYAKPKHLIKGFIASVLGEANTLTSEVVALPVYRTQLADEIKINSLSDLLDYESVKGGRNKWDFLADAMHRFENGETPFTLSRNGRLYFCCWLSKQRHDQNSTSANESALLHELFYEGADQIDLQDILANVANLVALSSSANTVFLSTPNSKFSN